jgi:EAL domain-containing protein (putative c-di-GMP-specific phosphodiesterase class I)
VVAVGIETEEQLKKLRMLHCPKGQGYYFAKPMEEKSLRSLLSSHRGGIKSLMPSNEPPGGVINFKGR